MPYSKEVQTIFKLMFEILDSNDTFDSSLLEQLRSLWEAEKLEDTESIQNLLDQYTKE